MEFHFFREPLRAANFSLKHFENPGSAMILWDLDESNITGSSIEYPKSLALLIKVFIEVQHLIQYNNSHTPIFWTQNSSPVVEQSEEVDPYWTPRVEGSQTKCRIDVPVTHQIELKQNKVTEIETKWHDVKIWTENSEILCVWVQITPSFPRLRWICKPMCIWMSERNFT